MKKLFVTMFLLISISICYGQEDAFFKNYPAENKYNGKIVLPEGYRKEEGLIFNDINKAVELTINYNGKYAIVRNSCGTGCMYLTLVDVSNGLSDNPDLESMLGSLKLISFIIVLFAVILCLLVVFNLTNMNISERERELATLKVLGYNDFECSMYTFREILISSKVFTSPLRVW